MGRYGGGGGIDQALTNGICKLLWFIDMVLESAAM